MKKSASVLFFILSIYSLPCLAQTFYTSTNAEAFTNCVELTKDSGYVSLGFEYVGNNDGDNFLLIKMDKYGDTIFCKQFNDLNYAEGAQVMELTNGDFMLFGTLPFKLHLLKVDGSGNLLWNKSYFDSLNITAAGGFFRNSDGGYTITGNGYGTPSMTVIRVDSTGNVQWAKKFFTGAIYDCRIKPDIFSGSIISSRTFSGSIVMKLDSSGNVIWNKHIQDFESGLGNSLLINNDGSMIITGTYEYSSGQDAATLLKMDSAGNLIWARYYHASVADLGYGVSYTSDNGYVICGKTFTSSTALYPADLCLIKTDSIGMLSWARRYDLSYNDWGAAINETIDSCFVIAGGKGAWGMQNVGELFILKTDSAGINNCQLSNSFSLIQSNVVLAISNSIISNTAVTITTDTVSLLTTSPSFFNHCYASTEVNVPLNNESNSIYPNPSREKFFVHLNENKKTRFALTDITGKEIAFTQTQISNLLHEINVGKHAAGIFILKMMCGGEIKFEKVVMN